MNTIVTFYSYKGGVGRSMALANIAVLLARRKLRVLAVDWDLEAPGIENYFSAFRIANERPGLLSMLMDFMATGEADYNDYLWPVSDGDHGLTLLSSGRATDSRYSANLERFDWDAFFERGGGDFLESLRERWREAYDVTLIDSRTGLSDSGGICTIQLPDVIVAMFTANHQSLYGVRDVMRLAQEARHALANDRAQLSVIPLASRFGNDFRESSAWLDRTTEAMSEFYRDWLPSWVHPREVVDRLKVPHVDYFGYGEKLAVLEQGTSDPQGMGFAYDKVADLLASDLSDAETIFQLKLPAGRTKSEPEISASTHDEYDLYVSYPHTARIDEWVRPFVERLRQYVGAMLHRPVSAFLDYRVVEPGSVWPAQVEHALTHSRVLLAIITPVYFQARSTIAEWHTFENREAALRWGGLIFPVLVEDLGANVPIWFRRRHPSDMRPRAFPPRWEFRMEEELRGLGWSIAQALRRESKPVDFPVVSPKDV